MLYCSYQAGDSEGKSNPVTLPLFPIEPSLMPYIQKLYLLNIKTSSWTKKASKVMSK